MGGGILARADKSHAHTQSLEEEAERRAAIDTSREMIGKRRVDQWNPNDKAAKSSWKKFLLLH